MLSLSHLKRVRASCANNERNQARLFFVHWHNYAYVACTVYITMVTALYKTLYKWLNNIYDNN